MGLHREPGEYSVQVLVLRPFIGRASKLIFSSNSVHPHRDNYIFDQLQKADVHHMDVGDLVFFSDACLVLSSGRLGSHCHHKFVR